MKKHKGNGIIIIGLLCILAALFLLLKNISDGEKASRKSDEILQQFETTLEKSEAPSPEAEAVEDVPPEPAAEEIPVEITEDDIKGDENGVLGVLSLPPLGLDLPILADWSYDRLETAPCRYSGSARTKNLVICAHNFPRHFGKLNDLAEGDLLTFTDWKGNSWSYVVDSFETLKPTAIDDVVKSDWALSLFTCTYGGHTRFVVRCNMSD